jgi:hypothetical protein
MNAGASRLLLLAYLLFAAGEANAEDLFTVSVNESGLVLLDKDSLQERGDTKRIWVYAVNPNNDGLTVGLLPYAASLVELDCKQERYRDLNTKFFRSNGEISSERRDATDWNFGLPNSPAALVTRIVCSGRFDVAASLKGQTIQAAILAYRQLVEAHKRK